MRRLDDLFPSLMVNAAAAKVFLKMDQPHYLQSLATYERAGFDLYHLSMVNRGADGGVQELNAYLKRH